MLPSGIRHSSTLLWVKAARWHGLRYQAAIRNHKADLLLFACKTPVGALDWFVIPSDAYAGVSNIAVWTVDPSEHAGQWFDYYKAWWWVEAIVNGLPEHRDWQLSLEL